MFNPIFKENVQGRKHRPFKPIANYFSWRVSLWSNSRDFFLKKTPQNPTSSTSYKSWILLATGWYSPTLRMHNMNYFSTIYYGPREDKQKWSEWHQSLTSSGDYYFRLSCPCHGNHPQARVLVTRLNMFSVMLHAWWRHQMENIFRVTGHLCGEFTGHRWIPCTKASDAEFWCFLWSSPEHAAE